MKMPIEKDEFIKRMKELGPFLSKELADFSDDVLMEYVETRAIFMGDGVMPVEVEVKDRFSAIAFMAGLFLMEPSLTPERLKQYLKELKGGLLLTETRVTLMDGEGRKAAQQRALKVRRELESAFDGLPDAAIVLYANSVLDRNPKLGKTIGLRDALRPH